MINEKCYIQNSIKIRKFVHYIKILKYLHQNMSEPGIEAAGLDWSQRP